jgi:predicted acylesterase/phospholipase RssA
LPSIKVLKALPTPFTVFQVEKKKKAVLSLDGGGVRGFISTYVLEVLEKELREQTGIHDLLIAEAFDIVAGTSTGSILATYLTAYCGLTRHRLVTSRHDKKKGCGS